MLTLTVEQLFAFALAGTGVSLVLEYFPRLNAWYNALEDRVQQLFVLGSGLLVVLGAWLLNCFAVPLGLPWACAAPGAYDAVIAFVSYIFATQGTYLVTPKVSNG
jgi:hypothetical protein